MTHPPERDWWQALYDDIIADLLLRRNDETEYLATIAFLRDHLRLALRDRVFDQCCGTGVLALGLARVGYRVVGVDQAEAYCGEARAQAEAESLAARFFAGDAREFVPPEPCVGAFNWNTGFGNGSDDANRRMLRRAFETLEPGGRFALDYQHIPRILARFQTCLVHRREGAEGETVLLRQSSLDLAGGALRQVWTFFHPDGRRVVRHSAIRLYLPHVLGDMLKACGFCEIRYHGGVRGEPLTPESPRCIVVAQRPDQ